MVLNEQLRSSFEASLRRLEPGQSMRRTNESSLKMIFNTTDIGAAVEAAQAYAALEGCVFDYDPEQGIGIFRRVE